MNTLFRSLCLLVGLWCAFFALIFCTVQMSDVEAQQPKRTAPPILFISGFNQSSELMRPLAERVSLLSGRTVVQQTLPLPRSAASCDRSDIIEQWKIAVSQAAAESGGGEIDVVAHSLGATVTMQLADEGRLRIRRAVFLAPALKLRPQIAALLASARLFPESLMLPSLGPSAFSLEKKVCVGSYQAMRSLIAAVSSRDAEPFRASVIVPTRDEFVSPTVLTRFFPKGAVREIHPRATACPRWQHLFPHPDYAGAETFEEIAELIAARLK